MSNPLKKEFKHSDVQRMRNIIKKDFTSNTKLQTGYRKTSKDYKEGDIWEENGKQWTIKNGIKQNITKLDAAKQAVKVPLTCPKCGGSMTYHLSKETYKKSGMCFHCFMDYTEELQKNGLLEQYLTHKRKGNIKYFIETLQDHIKEVNKDSTTTFVTEHGDIEDWEVNDTKHKKDLTENLQQYIDFLNSKLE